MIATIHRETFNRQEYQDFFSKNRENLADDQVTNLSRGLERISPEIFGMVPADGLMPTIFGTAAKLTPKSAFAAK